MLVLDDWLLTPQRAAIHQPTCTAVIADVHLGYSEARRRNGDAVPLANGAQILAPLQPLVKKYHLRQLVIAGDLFEAVARPELVETLLTWCKRNEIEPAVVPGNHDRGIGSLGGVLPVHPDGVNLGRWRVIHGDVQTSVGAIVQGHEHPWARWSRRVGGPCYLVHAERLILPAFSRDAAGVNVLDHPRWTAFRCCVIAGERVLDFGCLGGLQQAELPLPTRHTSGW